LETSEPLAETPAALTVAPPRVWIVVPCYDEATRLDTAAFEAFLGSRPELGFIFVNDGSKDDTLKVLSGIRDRCGERVRVVDQQPNQGKAEAVRVGMLEALGNGVAYAGYFDADLATPLAALDELVETLDENADIDIAVGTRVALLGRKIERRPLRHYSGRLFATAASLVLSLPIYDTQCGAKLFRSSAAMRELFSKPFGSRWIFDVELLARYLSGPGSADGIYEMPLKRWTDVGESRVRTIDFVRAIGEMAAILREYRVGRGTSSLFRWLGAPFLRYVGAGGVGTSLHYALLVLFVEALHTSPAFASVVGAMAGAAVNYLLNYHLTFVSLASHRHTVPRFFTVAAFSTALNGVGMSFLVEGLGLHYLLSQIVCTAGVLAVGYLLNKSWTFRNRSEPEEGPRSRPLLAWSLLRLPLVLLLVYVFREPLFALIEKRFDIVHVTHFIIDVASTPLARSLCLMAVATLLALALVAARRPLGSRAWLFGLGAGLVTIVGLFRLTQSSALRMLPALALLSTNIAEDAILGRLFATGRSLHRFFVWGVGAELLFLGRFVRWLGTLAPDREHPERREPLDALPGVLLVSAVAALCLDGRGLVSLEQAARMPDGVRIVDHGNINGISLDAGERYLFATGVGLGRLRRYDLENLTAPPLESSESSGHAQGLDYDPVAHEIYVHHTEAQSVLVFDEDLRLKRRIEARDVSPGDPWVAVDGRTATISIVSEADQGGGVPFLVIDRNTGAVIDRRQEDAGNLLHYPEKSWIYLSFYRRISGVMTYDLVQRRITQQAMTDQRIDRMAFWRAGNELLATSPTRGLVLRYDADSLTPKGSFRTLFGVRVLAIDDQRQVVLCGSLTTGKIAVVDLATGRELESYYLGPWLRSVVVVPSRSRAYVSSNGTLYELQYLGNR
jgi:putative flippase GtrA/DNA-binding beta-propeller fold protein YncE